MKKGTVKWFNESKGNGFITPDEGGDDLYFEPSSIEITSHTLIEGQRVEFEVIEGKRGLEAIKIHSA